MSVSTKAVAPLRPYVYKQAPVVAEGQTLHKQRVLLAEGILHCVLRFPASPSSRAQDRKDDVFLLLVWHPFLPSAPAFRP